MPRNYRDKQVENLRAEGWVTASAVSEGVHLAPSTIYRLAYTDTVVWKKIGSALYLEIESLRAHFGEQTIKDAEL